MSDDKTCKWIYAGYTLLEIMVALLIASILLLVAVTAGRDVVARHQALIAADQLQVASAFARHMTNEIGASVTLCGSSDGQYCNGAWTEGQLIFIDENNNGIHEVTETRLRVMPPLALHPQLLWNGFHHADYAQFHAQSLTNAMTGSFHYCLRLGQRRWAWRLIINRLGRTRLLFLKECSL